MQLQREMEARQVAHKQMMEKVHGNLGGEITKLEEKNAELRQQLHESKLECTRLNGSLETEKREREDENKAHAKAMEQKAQEMEKMRKKYERELQKVEEGVNAIASGRGRLEQVKELHAKMEKKEREWEDEKAELERTVESLREENEGLAESNAELTQLLENKGEGALEELGETLQSKDYVEQIKQLEASTMRQLEVIEHQEAHTAKVRIISVLLLLPTRGRLNKS